MLPTHTGDCVAVHARPIVVGNSNGAGGGRRGDTRFIVARGPTKLNYSSRIVSIIREAEQQTLKQQCCCHTN
jgi:hypothetical protein